MALDTGNTTSPGPETPAGFANSLENNVNYGIDLPQFVSIPSKNSVYTGTLSAHGSIVAMTINPGAYKYVEFGTNVEGQAEYITVPYLTGYLREYWKNPQTCNLGADSAIPAITSVMPARFSSTPGNALYYFDLQLTRLTGSNYFDNYYFINTFNQLLGWVTNANNYLLAVNNSQKRNLEYFGVTSYQEFLTQGFNRYAEGQALKTAIGNIGTLIQQIPLGSFGTSNSVAKHLVDNGLGAIGQLTAKIQAAGINYSDILNPIYTNQINEILRTIDNLSDLNTIQIVLKSTVPSLRSVFDYTSIEVCSGGRPNDSVFRTFQDFGKDLFEKTPNFNIATGKQLADLIDTVLSQATQNVEDLATNKSLLPPDIIQNFKRFLPQTPDGKAASLLNVIGCATGYLIDNLNQVNSGLERLSKTNYGSLIHTALSDITTAFSKYRTSYFSNLDNEIQTYDLAAYRQFQDEIKSYNSLLVQISNDPTTQNLVQQINFNWDRLCELLSTEVINYNKANVSISSFNDNTTIYSFVSSLPGYALDTSGLGTDYFLYSMCQPNQAGDIVKSILNQYKNNEILANAGVQIRGVV